MILSEGNEGKNITMEQTEKDKQEKDRQEKDEQLKERMSKIDHKLVVISGKGGVGKTTVAVNLACGLAVRGNKVGILDVDIHGPNIAKMLGIEGRELVGSDAGIEPVMVTNNLKAISISFLLKDKDQPVIWRGPLKTMTIRQFLGEVNWGEIDYLIIDSPPGTGDEPLSVCQLIPDIDGAIIVTTPQEVALLDSRKSVVFAKQLNVPVVGIIENMSGFICPYCLKEIDLFGTGGGEKSARDLQVPFLGRIPLEPAMVKSGDAGKPFILSESEKSSAKNMEKIIDKIAEFAEKEK